MKKDNVLYARLTDSNSDFLKKTAKSLKISKTKFINYHIAYLRANLDKAKLQKQLAKTRDKIQG